MPRVVVKCGLCDAKITLKRKTRTFRHCGISQEVNDKSIVFVGAGRIKKEIEQAPKDQDKDQMVVIE